MITEGRFERFQNALRQKTYELFLCLIKYCNAHSIAFNLVLILETIQLASFIFDLLEHHDDEHAALIDFFAEIGTFFRVFLKCFIN